MNNCIKTETAPAYNTKTKEDAIIKQAMEILELRMRSYDSHAITSPDELKDYLVMKLVEREHEVFSVLFLDNRHRVISYDELFRGTFDGASVYPREVVKEALKYNAAAVIFVHNHPSGVAEPSSADLQITTKLKAALDMFSIRVLDHIIIGTTSETVSFAERGLL